MRANIASKRANIGAMMIPERRTAKGKTSLLKFNDSELLSFSPEDKEALKKKKEQFLPNLYFFIIRFVYSPSVVFEPFSPKADDQPCLLQLPDVEVE